MIDVGDARRVLGVDPDADPAEIRAAYRRRIRALHPDLSGDETPANRAAVAELVDAFQCLQSTAAAGTAPRGAEPDDPTIESLECNDESDGHRFVQRAMATMIVLTAVVVVVFFLIAFSQSGR